MNPYLEKANDVSRDEVYRRIARDLRSSIETLGAGTARIHHQEHQGRKE